MNGPMLVSNIAFPIQGMTRCLVFSATFMMARAGVKLQLIEERGFINELLLLQTAQNLHPGIGDNKLQIKTVDSLLPTPLEHQPHLLEYWGIECLICFALICTKTKDLHSTFKPLSSMNNHPFLATGFVSLP